jgi:CDP-diacylglycerol--glycerol-3-phosphate 3-phosphatidyltransferase
MLLAGFLFSPWPQGWLAYVPGLLYVSAALADLFDGYLARISHHESRLGAELDLSLDGLGILIASLLLVQYGQVQAWYLLVGLARYLFIGGIWLRNRLGKSVHPLAKNSARRPFAGAQMGFAAVALFPVFSPPGTYLAAALFAVPFLIGFLLDWFSVSGISFVNLFKSYITWEKFAKLVYTAKKKFSEQVLNKWLPLLLRAALVILSIVWIHENILGLFQSLGSPTINQYLPNLPPIHWTGISMFLMFSGLILIAVGVAGRAAALFVLFGLGMYLEFFSLDLFEVGLVFASVGLFYLGTGPYSLWIPEREIITQRLGEP